MSLSVTWNHPNLKTIRHKPRISKVDVSTKAGTVFLHVQENIHVFWPTKQPGKGNVC